MNIIGHPYVANLVLGRLNPQLVLGSYLPDIVPFVPDSVFTFEEIHQGGREFLKYLQTEEPGYVDLAYGMMIHAEADKYSRVIEDIYSGYRDELSREIAETSGVSIDVARKSRFHNYLWWGVDLQILWNRRNFVLDLRDTLEEIDENTSGRTAVLLAECFDKSVQKTADTISTLIQPFEPTRFLTADGLAVMWRDIAAGLPEQDDVDSARTSELFKKCAFIVGNRWKEFVHKAVVSAASLPQLKNELG